MIAALLSPSLVLSTAAPARSARRLAPVRCQEQKILVPEFPEVCEQTGLTLSRYMCEIARANPQLQDLESLVSSIQTACKTINSLVSRAHITGLVGYADGGGSINVQGEEPGHTQWAHSQLPPSHRPFRG